MLAANSMYLFAHETGHFLGLWHVFEPGGDYCDDTPKCDRKAYPAETEGDFYFYRRDVETQKAYYSDNIMDYNFGFMTGFTPDQSGRIRYTLQHAYFIPDEGGKEEPAVRSF